MLRLKNFAKSLFSDAFSGSILLSVALHAGLLAFVLIEGKIFEPEPKRLSPELSGIEVSVLKESEVTLPAKAILRLSSAPKGPIAPDARKGEKTPKDSSNIDPTKSNPKKAQKPDEEQLTDISKGNEKGQSDKTLEEKQRDNTDIKNLLKTVETIRSKERSLVAERVAQLSKVAKREALDNDALLKAAKAALETQGKKGEANNNDIAGLLSQISDHYAKCWKIPAGIGNIHKMSVEIFLQFDSSGNTNRAKVVLDDNAQNSAGETGKPVEFRMLAESALRAVWNPKCSPIGLPKERYDEWKQLIIVFDPSKAVG